MTEHELLGTPRHEPLGGAVTGVSWSVDQMRGIDGSLESVIEGSRIEAVFDEAGTVSGSAGCNSYRGSCRLEDGVVSVGVLATTRKFCQRPPGVMEQESRYLELLTAATGYSLDGDTLRLIDDSNVPLLSLTRAEGVQGE